MRAEKRKGQVVGMCCLLCSQRGLEVKVSLVGGANVGIDIMDCI